LIDEKINEAIEFAEIIDKKLDDIIEE